MLRGIGFRAVEEPVDAPSFSLSEVDGERHAPTEVDAYVFVNFCQTWCSTCRSEKPMLKELIAELDEFPVQVYSVVAAERPKDVAAFVDELEIPYPVLVDADGSVSSRYAISVVPTTFLLDPDGRILGSVAGEMLWNDPEVVRTLSVIVGR